MIALTVFCSRILILRAQTQKRRQPLQSLRHKKDEHKKDEHNMSNDKNMNNNSYIVTT